MSKNTIMDNATIWKIIDSHFRDNPQSLVRHHIDSYNDFYKTSIYNLFKEKNPIRLYSRLNPKTNEYMSQCNLYMGGKNGDRIYFGKPVINDDENAHYMFPNEARLRNMTYGMTIHYDIDIEFIDTLEPGELPTIIGSEMEKEIEGGSLVLDEYSVADENSGNALKNFKMSKTDVFNSDALAEKNGGNGEDSNINKIGNGPKPVKIKAKGVKKAPLEMTPTAAAHIREATEKSMSENNTQTRWHALDKIYLGKFPIMLQSDFCVLQSLPKEIRHSMGECRNDLGGYFIIDGKEKTVVAQEKFADNMLYVRKSTDDKYTFSADIRSVSENASKPVRTLSVKICDQFSVKDGAKYAKFTGGNIVVKIPNVRSPVPLFIVFRALGILSDKSIIEHCILDMDKYQGLIDLFIPSVHDAANILTQQNALNYISLLTKGKTTFHALEILSDYFLPHVGEINYIPKAYALGAMVFRLLAVSQKIEPPTDRDNFKYKRIELVGSLLYDLFREYWNIQLRQVHLEFEKRLYYNPAMYENNLFGLILDNYRDVFKERALETGFRKAFKGNWGAQTHTKRIGVVQDLNRLSFNSAINHLRKTNLPLDSSVKLVGPRVLHNSQWGYIDPIDTPDGGSIGLNKHLAISTYITRGSSREPMIEWLREKWGIKLVEEFSPRILSQMTKVIVNGCWIGSVNEPIECIDTFRLFRRNALIPIYSSATFDIPLNTIFVYTDAGRLCRPIFYRDPLTGRASYQSKKILKLLQDGEFSWTDLIAGFNKKRETVKFDTTQMKIYELYELYEGIESETNPAKLDRFLSDKAILDYIDTSESENAMIALNANDFEMGRLTELTEGKSPNKDQSPKTPEKSQQNRFVKYTHCEIHNSFILGMMCNMIIFPENNPATRNSFSCGQSKQACSMYHTNYQVRMDKTAVLLNYGQTPLVKSQFLEHITNEEHPYGENAIVAIACYTGYNVEDAVLINEGALQRGLFRTTYFTCYEAHEESTKNLDTIVDHRFMNIDAQPAVLGTKPGYDYGKLDQYGIIREGTPVDDKTVLIGLATVGAPPPGSAVTVQASYLDDSKTPKKGQLGVVDKAFITDGEEGQRIAKVRILEQRIPTLGDKMASRSGQKGTIGMVVPERDMPFTSAGIRPDIIINPHAIPTRMTIGQLVECITGKSCAVYGGFGDCTAFNNNGSKIGVFGELLSKQGFHSSGNEIMYNGMSGEQLEAEIFMGPTYYMRLKHMVKDKINFRALGPRTALTKQPVSGRANDGGLRIGEMERDTLISHGMTDFLRESMMERGDKSYLAVCNNSGMISIYNPSKGLFMSPMADGPLRFTGSLESNDMRVEHITKHGRSFSVVCIPYSLKLLIQELQTINVQIRIITDDNIDQMENLSYSNNIGKLTHSKDIVPKTLIEMIKQTLASKGRKLVTPESVASSISSEKTSISSVDSENEEKSPIIFTPASMDEDYVSGSDNEKDSDIKYIEAYSPNFSPPSPSPDKTGGSGPSNKSASQFQVGGKVLLRGAGDGYAARPWEITKIGDQFLTIQALDPRGLTLDQQLRVVSEFDIFPASQLFGGGNGQNNLSNEMGFIDPMNNGLGLGPGLGSGLNPAPVHVHVSPKFFNGGGSDNSTNQPSNEIVEGPIVGGPIVGGATSNTPQKMNIGGNLPESAVNSDTLDFSKPMVINKLS